MKKGFIIFGWLALLAAALYLPSTDLFPRKDDAINLFVWGDTIEPSVFAEFEKETGIKINLSYYASNEELLVKVRATEGRGYDLILPSDYTVNLLIKDDLLQPLDKSKLTFYDNLLPSLLDHPFDPGNTYSIPFEWEVYGLGINPAKFTIQPDSWSALFENQGYRIATRNDPIENVQFAGFYLFNTVKDYTPTQFEGIRSLLLEQRHWVEAYSDSRPDYFLAVGTCPVVLSISSKMRQLKQRFPYVTFKVPKEGTFAAIESFCIPKASNRQAEVYKLLNYLYTDASLLAHTEAFGFYPVTKTQREKMTFEENEREFVDMEKGDFRRLHFFERTLPHQQIIDLWVEVKSF